MAQRKKKDSGEAYRTFLKELSDEKLGNLYIFHGEETYLRDHYLREMKKILISGGLDDFNYHVLTAREYSIQRLRELIDSMPMMSERTMVVVYDQELGKKDREELFELLSDLPDYLCLVFVYDVVEYKSDGQTKLGKLLKEKAQVVEFARQEQKELIKWVARRFRALDHDISAADAEYLILLCGDLMNTLISEIGKISAYAREQRITRQDIDAVATPQLDAVVYELTNAIAAGNFDGAFAEMSEMLQMQEPPIMILASMGKQFRRIYTARLGMENGKDARWLAELWDFKYPSQAERLISSARKFSLEWCRRAVLRCEEMDLALKSTGADPQELLTGLLLELSQKRAV